jgi:hypothetical protein
MNLSNIFKFVFHSLVLLIVQLFIFRDYAIFGLIFSFVHVGIIIFMPTDTPVMLAMIIAFFVGYITDAFYDTLGIHAAALVLLAYVRPYIVKSISDQGEIKNMQEYTVGTGGAMWFFQLVFIHTLLFSVMVFFLESMSLSILLRTLVKIVFTTIFTSGLLTMYSYLWMSSKRSR